MRTWYVARREMIHLLRDRRALGAFISMPAVMVLLFGYALSFDIRHLRLVVYDQNCSADSRHIVERFVQSRRFDVVGYMTSERDFRRHLDFGWAQVGIKIPSRLSQELGT